MKLVVLYEIPVVVSFTTKQTFVLLYPPAPALVKPYTCPAILIFAARDPEPDTEKDFPTHAQAPPCEYPAGPTNKLSLARL